MFRIGVDYLLFDYNGDVFIFIGKKLYKSKPCNEKSL